MSLIPFAPFYFLLPNFYFASLTCDLRPPISARVFCNRPSVSAVLPGMDTIAYRSPTALASRVAAFILAACSLATIVAISHHPVVRARRGTQVIEGIVAVGPADRAVHGTLLVIVLAMVLALGIYTLQRRRLHVCIAAWMAFCCGSAGLVAAVLIDGFFVPGFAQRYIGASPDALAPALTVLNAAAVAIQVLSAFGFIAMNSGTLLWSVDL